MKAPSVRTTHVPSSINGLRRKCSAWTWPVVIDGARDIPADSSNKRDTPRRLKIRATHANASLVNPLDKVGWNESIRRFIKLLAPKTDAIGDAA